MREVQDDGTPPKGAYPSSGLPEEETAAPVDPFGPDADAQDLADPFSAADTDPARAAPATQTAPSSVPGAQSVTDPAQGFPHIHRSQVRDQSLADIWGLAPESGEQGAVSGHDAASDALGEGHAGTGPIGPGPGADTAGSAGGPGVGGMLSAARDVPRDLYSDSQPLGPDHTSTPLGATGTQSAGAQPTGSPAAGVRSPGTPDAGTPPMGAVAQASYPSATALPVKRPAPRSLASGLRRMIRSESLPTAPMRIVQRLANTPFANPRRNREHSEARRTLNFALRLAEAMFHFGAGSLEVETAIAATCATYGVEDVDVDITNQSVTINYVAGSGRLSSVAQDDAEGTFSHTVVRVVRSWSDNYSGLTDTHRLVKTITEGGLSRAEAERRLDRIMSEPKPFPRWMTTAANILAAFFLTIGIGGTWRGATLASATFGLIFIVSGWISRRGIPGFFISVVDAAMITAAALTASGLGLGVSPAHVVASGLIMLLPTLSLVSMVQDAINGFPVTAAGRLVSTGLTFLGLIAGLALAISTTSLFFGSQKIDVQQAVFTGAQPAVHVSFMLAATAMIAVSLQVRVRHIVPGVLSGAAGLAAYYAVSSLGMGPRMISMIGAVGVGCVSAWIADRWTIPQVVIAVPGVTFLLPGLSIFRGMYMFTVDVDPVQGLVPIINAGATILSLAAAVVLGNYLMRPFMRRERPATT